MIKKYLNIGCGGKFHKDWTNIDIVSFSPEVKSFNILKGIPFSENTFEAVYHSQVLEHIPTDKLDFFIAECFRVLKPGGIIRISTPDLESIAKLYIKWLDHNIETFGKDLEGVANYEWMKIEMYDQIARNKSGGEMWPFLKSLNFDQHQFIAGRIGEHLVKELTKPEKSRKEHVKNIIMNLLNPRKIIYLLTHNSLFTLIRGLITHLLPNKSNLRIGLFRTGGEVHYSMFDRFSLNNLLSKHGFKYVCLKNLYESSIPDFHKYELEIKNSIPYDTVSLFMEAIKTQNK